MRLFEFFWCEFRIFFHSKGLIGVSDAILDHLDISERQLKINVYIKLKPYVAE